MTKIIKVSTMPGTPVDVTVETGVTTVKQAIASAGMVTKGYQVKVDGVQLDIDATIPSNTILIVLAKKVKGN